MDEELARGGLRGGERLRAAGKPTLWQQVGAMCDQPIYAQWRLDANGTKTGKHALFRAGEGC